MPNVRPTNNILRQAVSLHKDGERFCLAVVIAKSGSAPQVPGAKGLFLRDGRIFGTIGGGCLEVEARRLGLEAMHTGRVLRREFKLDDDFGWDDGLVCGGRVQVLLLPRQSEFIDSFQQALKPGARGALVYDLNNGDVSFKCVNDGLQSESRNPISESRNPMADSRKPMADSRKPMADSRKPISDSRHSESEIALSAVESRREVLSGDEYAEPVLPPERLVIFGGGHIGNKLSRIAADLGFSVTIVDDRKEFVTEEHVPWVSERVCELPHVYAASVETDKETYICIVTRGHRNDSKVLREMIRKPRAYLGMIGSRRKRELVRKEMVQQGICSKEEFDAVRSPMGLGIGAESVTEIAVSIAAELVKVRAELRGPIRARCGQRPLAVESEKPRELPAGEVKQQI